MYVNMITRLVYKKKEVSTPPNKMKHISPLQRHVFLPLTCTILKKKRNHIFSTISPFFCHDWQRIQETRKLHPRNIKMVKDDQGDTKNPYKCMNVMKQDAMDDMIKEGCKTCEKKMHARGSRHIKKPSSSYWVEANLNGSNSYRANRKFLDELRICQEAIETKFRKLDGSRLRSQLSRKEAQEAR